MKYSRIVSEFYSRIWVLREETLMAMQSLIRQQANGVKWTTEEIRERISAANAASGYVGHENFGARFLARDNDPIPMLAASGKRNAAAPGSVAVIPLTGIVSHRMSLMSEISGGGGSSIQSLTAQFRQALEDGNCKAIVFDVDSPGGSVEGVMELASEVYEARKQKPSTSVANAMSCSAAYWISSAASDVVITPSGQAGSIGVYMMLADESEALKNDGIKISLIRAGKFKAEGHPSEPLTDEARAFMQSQVNSVYGMFVKSVAQQRGTSQAAVRDGMGQGRSLLANDAVKANLADRTGTLDEVLAKYGVKKSAGRSGSRAEVHAQMDDGEACHACRGCTAADACRGCGPGKACICGCDACKSCDFKTGTKTTHTHAPLAAKKPVDDGPDNEPDNDQDDRDQACHACKACRASKFCGCHADDDMGCECACDACHACENRDGAKSSLTTPKLTAEEEKVREAAEAGELLGVITRRRRMELDLLEM